MLPVQTRLQIEKIKLDNDRPLLICDVDDVVVHFIREFETYLDQRDLVFNVTGFHLSGSIASRSGERVLELEGAQNLVLEFFTARTLHMLPIDGALQSLSSLEGQAEIVFLTNLPEQAGEHRRENLRGHGLAHPVIVNTGPKGPAVRALAAKTKRQTVFIDDNPGFLQSSNEYAPHVKTVHFLHDKRFLPHIPALPFLDNSCDNWDDARAFISQALG